MDTHPLKQPGARLVTSRSSFTVATRTPTATNSDQLLRGKRVY
jgi:hypothetical protein